jgi:hypothetical protein
MAEEDETIGNVHQIEGGLQSGLWQWSMTVRRIIEVYRDYLSTWPEQYPRYA